MAELNAVPRGAADPPSGLVRWTVLALVSLAMFGNYYVYDSIGPVADLLGRQLGFTDTNIGTLNAIYSVPNVVMVLIGGIIVDRLGAGVATVVFTAICLAGAVLTAATPAFEVMAAGRLVYGLGAESMIVAVTATLGRWFKGRELGLAFGLNLSVARAGSYLADVSPNWAKGLYEQGWQPPLWLAAGFAAGALVAVVAYWVIERRESARNALGAAAEERIAWRQMLSFPVPFWLLVGLCVCFYAAVFPFRSTFAIKYFQHAYTMTLADASELNSYVFLAAIFATPAFGYLVDKVGRRTWFMLVGSLLCTLAFLVLIGKQPPWMSTVLIGIAFSLVPAVIWPSVAYVVDTRRLGTALGLMTMIQNIGLAASNLGAGALNDAYAAGPTNPAGYDAMLWMFTAVSGLGVLFAVVLCLTKAGLGASGLDTIRARAATPA